MATVTTGINTSNPIRRSRAPSPVLSQASGSAFRSDDGSLWNPEAWTVDSEFDRGGIGKTEYNANERLIFIGNADNNTRIQLQALTTGFPNIAVQLRVVIAGTTHWNISYGFGDVFENTSGVTKFQLRYKAGVLWFYIDGIPRAFKTVPMPETVERICVGKDAANANATKAESVGFAYYNEDLTDAQFYSIAVNDNILSGITYDPAISVVLGTGQSPNAGPSDLTNDPSYTGNVNMLKLDGTYVAYDDPHMDVTGNLFRTSIWEGRNPQTSYNGYVLEDLAVDGNEYCVVGAAYGGTSMASDWQIFEAGSDSDMVIKDLMAGCCIRLLQAMQVGRLILIIEDQGASDALLGTASATYKAAKTAKINLLRALAGSNIRAALIGLHSWDELMETNDGITEVTWNGISGDNEAVASEISNAYFVDISDILPRSSSDLYHYGASDQPILAARVSSGL